MKMDPYHKYAHASLANITSLAFITYVTKEFRNIFLHFGWT